MLKPTDRLYLTDIIKLTQNKSNKVRIYAKLSKWLFDLSVKYKDKASMLVLSGGNPEKFQNKIKDRLKKIDAINKNSTVFSIGPSNAISIGPSNTSRLKEVKSKTYQDAIKNKEPIGLVPARPGFFKMTDDVPPEKRTELEKLPVVKELEKYVTKAVNEEVKKKDQARTFYYKRKRKKFNPQKFNNDRKDN